MFSPSGRERVAATGNDPGKVVSIPNGVDLELAGPPTPSVERDEFTVTYVGTHGAANYLDPVLDAAALIRSSHSSARIRFRFVGEGLEKARLVERACRERLNNVCFDGAVRKEQIPAILSEADALVLTAPPNQLYCRWMGFNKLYDYLSSARPVIFSCNAVTSPVHESGAGVCVSAADPQAIADAVLKLYAMSCEERWQMGLKGRRFVEQHHNISSLAGRLESMLFSVTSRTNQDTLTQWKQVKDAAAAQANT